MTTNQTAKVNGLRAEAEIHGDGKMIAICDAALMGDVAALATCGIVTKAAKAAPGPKGTRKSAWATPARQTDVSDIEDLGHAVRS